MEALIEGQRQQKRIADAMERCACALETISDHTSTISSKVSMLSEQLQIRDYCKEKTDKANAD